MTTTKMALAMTASLALTACFDPGLWYGHGHEPGHGHGHDGGGCTRGDDAGCAEDCPSASHFRTAAGACRRKALTVSAGTSYSCAVLSGGDVKCWGDDHSRNVLGYSPPVENRGDSAGEMGNALPAVALGDGLRATNVSAAGDVTCALIEGGRLKCWGYDGHGLITMVDNNEALVPIAEARLRTFTPAVVQVELGDGTAFVLHADGSLSFVNYGTGTYSVGAMPVVQFARGSLPDRFDVCAVIAGGDVYCVAGGRVELGTGRRATQVALGDQHYCALFDDGSVKCWGQNFNGQLGQDDTTTRNPRDPFDPTDLASMAPVALGQAATAITAGQNHTCAILSDGSVKCWGFNGQGQLGIGTMDDTGDAFGDMSALPSVNLGTGRTAVAIDARTHTCALLDNGGIKCWGANTTGALGQGDMDHRGDDLGELGDALPEIDLGS